MPRAKNPTTAFFMSVVLDGARPIEALPWIINEYWKPSFWTTLFTFDQIWTPVLIRGWEGYTNLYSATYLILSEWVFLSKKMRHRQLRSFPTRSHVLRQTMTSSDVNFRLWVTRMEMLARWCQKVMPLRSLVILPFKMMAFLQSLTCASVEQSAS